MLTDRHRAALARAREVGFLIAPRSQGPSVRAWRARCAVRGRPFVQLAPYKADTFLVLDVRGPTGWRPSRRGRKAARRALEVAGASRWTPRIGDTRGCGVPHDRAEPLARLLLSIVALDLAARGAEVAS